ncbi:hypothetical protein SHIRM173S_04644 [Streptomyces hirsutus]
MRSCGRAPIPMEPIPTAPPRCTRPPSAGPREIVALLLEAGASPDVESRDETDGTPLCAAAAWGHADVVRHLLAQGAGPGLREDDGEGRSPLEWAGNGHHTRTAELLLAAGTQGPDGTARAVTTPAGW